jgi:riboflavin kinase/FMN adenylyltransferase
MEYIKDTLEFEISKPSVISLGKFDGLHMGHRYLMEEMEIGKKDGLTSVVFTFDIPPKSIDRESYEVLSTNEEKEQIFRDAGVDYLIECPFTDELRQMTPYAFLKMLTEKINIKKIVAGTDFCFGYKRSGTYRDLQKYADEFGYEVVVVQKKQYNGADISSTRIRERIVVGDMQEANTLLGYAYFVSGPVLHGNEIGRTIGFPTVNQLPPKEKLLPPNGVYAVEVNLDGTTWQGVSNIGCKPTIQGENPIGVETFIFDFHDRIYGKQIKVSFLEYIRKEQKFESLEKLKEQLNKDMTVCRGIFEKKSLQ